jgi:hypothetical protein
VLSTRVATTLAASVVLGAVTMVSCSGRDVPTGYGPGPGSGGAGGAGGGDLFTGVGGGACDNDGACGEEVHTVEFDAPNIYFVLDKSGSMAELEGSESRYAIVRDAAKDFILGLGPLINIGAAVFPGGDVESDPCAAGEQVMEVTPGDPFDDGKQGPTTISFLGATKGTPLGGTPVSATLEGLESQLGGLTGETIVMLLTDGGPNCNGTLLCDVDSCMPNLEGTCEPTENCCAPDHPQGGPLLCLDEQRTVDAVGALAALGLEVYVIGITGSEFYEDVLDAMAVAAGTAQQGAETLYYRVDDLGTLSQVFADIAADAISCELPLADPPEEQGFTNVYFDCEVVTYDPASGWDWLDESTVRLNGAACAKLKSGQVNEVKIATGCPTEIPK